MPVVPNALALAGIADGSSIVASDHRNNYTAVQTAVNALISALSAGTAGQILSGTGTTLTWEGGYTAYTPAWTSTGTAPALGNSVVNARYLQIGKLVHCVGEITFGSTATFGSGIYEFSLPIARSGSGIGNAHGVVVATDTSASNYLSSGVPLTNSSVSTFRTFYAATYLGAVSNLGATAPWTWAVGDVIAWNLIYEAA